MTRLNLYDGLLQSATAGMMNGFIGAEIQQIPLFNGSGVTYDTYVIGVPATNDVAASTAYEVYVNGVTATFTTAGSGTTATQLRNGLFDALRASLVFNSLAVATQTTGAASAPTLTIKAVRSVEKLNVTVKVVAGAGALTLSNSVTPSVGSYIPFGVFVGCATGSTTPYSVKQISVVSDKVLGFAPNARLFERSGVGEGGEDGYPPSQTFSVITHTGANRSVWARTVDSDHNWTHGCYINVVASGKGGWVTKTSSSNIDSTAYLRIPHGESAIWSAIDDCYIIPVEIRGTI
jgi:hypothetical protein